MKLTIQKLRKSHDNFTFFEYSNIEIETFRWSKNHKFEYIIKGDNHHRTLEDNEEIIGLTI